MFYTKEQLAEKISDVLLFLFRSVVKDINWIILMRLCRDWCQTWHRIRPGKNLSLLLGNSLILLLLNFLQLSLTNANN
jgi:hypothetical protein